MSSKQTDGLKKNTFNRRQILTYLLGFPIISTLVGVLTPIVGFLVPPATGNAGSNERVLVGTTKDIPIGQGKVVPVGNKPVIVTNTDQGVKAFSAICTHLGCICIWDENRKVILCPCHDGQFNPLTGAVLSGPPPAPLPPIPISVEGEDIYVGEA
ncbi:MAG: Rieske 2Fe-2S domain-containing protein [Aquificales bacterium]|nr:Rieske 2Fe-2S domain-containing protein [Aquificales bacterium]